MTLSLSEPAFADPLKQETFDIVGDQYFCGDTALTAISGQSIVQPHEHEPPSGRVLTIFTTHLDNALLVDETGNIFPLSGSSRQPHPHWRRKRNRPRTRERDANR